MTAVLRSSSRTRLRRAVLVALAVAGIASLVLVTQTRAGVTQAAWVDTEYASATVSAAVIQPPEITYCTMSSGFLGANPVATVYWRFPAGSGYTALSNVAYAYADGGLLGTLNPIVGGSSLTTTGPSSGVYTTTIRFSLLSGTLGSTYGIFVQSVDGSGWTSSPAGATASLGILGVGATCDWTQP